MFRIYSIENLFICLFNLRLAEDESPMDMETVNTIFNQDVFDFKRSIECEVSCNQ